MFEKLKQNAATVVSALVGIGAGIASAAAITTYIDLSSAVAGSGSLITSAGSDKMLSFGGNILNILVDNLFGVPGLILAVVGIAYFLYKKLHSATSAPAGGSK